MSFVTAPRDIRVTDRTTRVTEGRREAVKVDFIPPDIAPVPTLALELEKGLAGWTDTDKVITEAVNGGVIVGRNRALVDEKRCGKRVIRAPRPVITRVVSAGPSASYRAAQARAAELAERGQAEARARKARKR